MMIKNSAFALALITLAACDKNDDQSKIDKAKAEQSQTITAANVEAEKKINNANAEADKKIDKAENKAAETIGEANSALTKTKADFTKTKQEDLAAIDKKLAELDAKVMKATGTARTNADASLKTAHAKRDALAVDVNTIGATSAATWDATKTRLDDAFSDLKKAVDAVKL